MTPTDTAELGRLAAAITPGPWSVDSEDQGAAWGTAYSVHVAGNILDEIADSVSSEANASAIALVPELIREVIAHRKAEAGMRALLLAGCDLLSIEAEALRNSIRIVGDPDRLSDAPEDAPAVEAITEMDDWIASVKATLYPTTLTEGGSDAE
ncbi:hypothetical protein [Paracoccus versutus]|uniref:hypothetical protein n=1 Tax=Paracoccus versutus TaxID=34007 RepID=UPI000DF79025|nr:hypothetical protein [Paracoccus versutus]RDD69250.1 hypothetical protein DVR11_22785 [Paracoccus versutus]